MIIKNDAYEDNQIEFKGFDKHGHLPVRSVIDTDEWFFYMDENDVKNLIKFLEAKIKERE
jgi:hypothetical protein